MASSRSVLLLPLLLAGLVTTGACSKGPETPPASKEASPAAAPPAQAEAPAVPTAMAAHAPTTAVPPAAGKGAAAVPTATGKILETMDSGGYTYVRLDTGAEAIWAATAPMKVKVGQELTVPLEMPMRNFHSSTLNRDFPVIYFASRVARGGEPLPARGAVAPQAASTAAAQAPAPGQMPAGHPPVGAAAAAGAIAVTEVIKPAAGGQSIADVWAQRAALSGKTVVVRGKVVKFMSGIMGKNWVHLQDGTGVAKDGTNDLTVTTDATAKPGDVVTATGTLAVDKDFGAGYKYGAIVEGASLSK